MDAQVLAVLAVLTACCLAASRAAPANPHYQFSYGVSDATTGDVKTHSETRVGGAVRGSYSLLEPGGTRRVVHYAADDVHGFTAVVQREGAAQGQHAATGPLHQTHGAAALSFIGGQGAPLGLTTPVVAADAAQPTTPGEFLAAPNYGLIAHPVHQYQPAAGPSYAEPLVYAAPPVPAAIKGYVTAPAASYAAHIKGYATEPTASSYAAAVPVGFAEPPAKSAYDARSFILAAGSSPPVNSYTATAPLAYSYASPNPNSYASAVPLTYSYASPSPKSYASAVPLTYSYASPSPKSYASAVPLTYSYASPSPKSYASAVPLTYSYASPSPKSYASAVPLTYASAAPIQKWYASAVPPPASYSYAATGPAPATHPHAAAATQVAIQPADLDVGLGLDLGLGLPQLPAAASDQILSLLSASVRP